MGDKIKRFLGLISRGVNTLDDVYARLIHWILSMAFVLGILGSGLNLAGYRRINLFLAAIFAVIIVIIKFRPKFLIAVASTGVAGKVFDKNFTPSQAYTKYSEALADTCFWIIFIFLSITFISFEGDPVGLFTYVAAVILLVVVAHFSGLGKIFSRWVALPIALIVPIAIIVLSLPPGILPFNPKLININEPRITERERVVITCEQILNNQVEFFLTNGESIYWYLKLPDGNFDFFNSSGQHPQTRKSLLPITESVVSEVIQSCQRGQEQKNKKYQDSIEEVKRIKAEKTANEKLTQRLVREKKKRLVQEELDAFKALIEKHNEKNWQPRDMWIESLSGKKVIVEYSNDVSNEAAEIISRLEKLGASIQFNKISNSNKAGLAEIKYPFSAIEQATDLQASMVDIIRLAMSSEPNLRTIIIAL